MTAEEHQGQEEERQINREKVSVEVKSDGRMKRHKGEGEGCEFGLSELISVSSRQEDWWTLSGRRCVSWRVVERPPLTQMYSPRRKKMCVEVLHGWMQCVYVHYTASHFQSNLMMERVGLDPSAFPHQSQPHSLCQPESLAVTSDPTSSRTTWRANRRKLALQIQRSDTTFPHKAAVWDFLHPQLDTAE